jgi:hypothetical protein
MIFCNVRYSTLSEELDYWRNKVDGKMVAVQWSPCVSTPLTVIIQNPPANIRRLFHVETNLFPGTRVACPRGGFYVKLDILYKKQNSSSEANSRLATMKYSIFHGNWKGMASAGDRTLIVQSVVRHCTDWSAPAPHVAEEETIILYFIQSQVAQSV